MEALFSALTHAVEGTALVAVAASFAWGIVSVLLSPCHLSSIPLVVGYVGRQGPTTTRRALVTTTVFSLGIFVSIIVVGAVTNALGRIMGDIGPAANYVVAAVFFVVGLYLMDVINIPWAGTGQPGITGTGLVAAFLLGLVFGAAVGPCTFAYMAPVLGVTFKVASTNITYATALVAAYAVGHCAVIVSVGTFTTVVQRYLDWNERSRGLVIFKRVCGALVVLAGLYMLHKS
jgi:cytochrome c-type biogenesis protein